MEMESLNVMSKTFCRAQQNTGGGGGRVAQHGLSRMSQPDKQSPDSSPDANDEQWLSQVEIITHAGPHRRLWMGPQFTFKTFSADSGNALSSSSPVLLPDCPESQASIMDMDIDLKSLCLTPRSHPVEMPKSHEAGTVVASTCTSLPYATFIEAAESGSYGHSPSVLEARYSWTDGTQGALVGDTVEDELRRHLEEAMTESPLKDTRKGTVHHNESPKFDDTPRSYSARSSPPHSIEHMLVFPGDSGNISSDSN